MEDILDREPVTPINPLDHYWTVGSKIFSSAQQKYVTKTNAQYLAFLEAGGQPTPMVSEAEMSLQNITILEAQQTQSLTPRALREFMLGVAAFAAAQGFPMPPAVARLQALDDGIKAERAKL